MSPRTSKQFEEIREQSRTRILEAAFELFATRGYHNTSISQIATEAGVAKGLIYNYFEKKDDLIHALIHDLMAEGGDILEKMMKIQEPKEQLKYLIELSFLYLIDRFHDTKLMTSLALQLDQFPDIQELVKSKYTGMMPLLSNLLQQIGIENYEEEANMLAATLDGIAMQYIVVQNAFPLEQMKNYLIQKYCT